jgi:5-methyltetrahydrofolate--homocysteine methyltransferase
MEILEKLKNGLVFFDGGFGTMLQARGLQPGEGTELWNSSHPEDVIAVHREYLDAGCNVVTTNTFGVNSLKYGDDTEKMVEDAVKCAKKAVEGYEDRFVALDIGPAGKLLKPLGDLDFEDAVTVFSRTVRAGAAAGADFVLIETMNDAYETKAALLAAKESCDLPVFVTNVYDEKGKLMTGAEPETMVAILEGLGADAVGMNCSLGPAEMKKLMPRFYAAASVPIIVNPNAGLPRVEKGKTVYDITPEEYAGHVADMVKMGAHGVGGCCGTTPAHIKKMIETVRNIPVLTVTEKTDTVVTSGSKWVRLGKMPILIGERINPTGKKKLKQALRDKDMTYILNEGTAQAERGVHILDVNVGLPEIDEPEMLTAAVKELQAVTELPLQIDTSSPEAMERALRIYNGKPLINSVNGKDESLDAILPLAKKYGGTVIALTLDESGIPETAEARLRVAEKIVRRAAQYGIAKRDIVVDPLALTISSDPTAAKVTLEAVSLIKEKLGVCTSLGVSNISFGLPKRDLVNGAFFAMALRAGLDAAIMNPFSGEMMKTYKSSMALLGHDKDCLQYIEFAETAEVTEVASASGKKTGDSGDHDLKSAIVHGMRELSAELTEKALAAEKPMDIINNMVIPALDQVGKGFETGEIFLPQLLMSADSASASFEAVKKAMAAAGTADGSRGKVVLATVKGDIHDIGKNIVRVLLENYGFEVIDLGRDVPAETVLETVERENAQLVGLSALMTTTVPSMEATIKLLHEKAPWCKVVVGGAVLNQEYADMIGADRYSKDAMETVRYAEEIFG